MKLSNTFSRRNRILLRELVVTDFKLRYQGSVLGYLWSLLKPLFMFAILYVVFGHFAKLDGGIEHFAVYLLLGIIFWTFFTEATNQGLASIVERGDLIRKINFPKYIIVISGTLSAFINLLLNLVIFAVFLVINGVNLHMSALLFPLYIIEMYVFSLSLAFFLSASYVKYRDISHIWEVLLQGAFYATPILYALQIVFSVSDTAAKIMLLNPVAQIIQDSRDALVTIQTLTSADLIQNPLVRLIPFVLVGVLIVVASYYFKKHSRYFSENV